MSTHFLFGMARLCAVGSVLTIQAGAATSYDFKILYDNAVTQVWGINNRAQIVGYIEHGWPGPNPAHYPVIYERGEFKPLNFKNATDGHTEAKAINDLGEIVFTTRAADGSRRDYVVHCGVRQFWNSFSCAEDLKNYEAIAVPGALTTTVTHLNNLGQIIGTYQTSSDSTVDGFLYENGRFKTIDVPQRFAGQPVVETDLLGINNLGVIVGQYRTYDSVTGTQGSGNFSYRLGKFAQILHQNDLRLEEVVDINDLGQVLASGCMEPCPRFPPSRNMWVGWNGKFTVVGDMPNRIPQGINNFGQVIGNEWPGVQMTEGFLATPQFGR